jgi:LacI family transcriptional regulator, repressor for deo operon, udp, cdd, tsx, nupC, and nupG
VVPTPATIKDVAAVAGVSIATVSRSLRNLSGVSDATRERVHEAARTLDYVMAPLPIGRAATALSRIAVVVPTVDTWFFGSMVGAVVARLEGLSCVSELYVLADQPARNRFFACAPLRRRVHGVVVIGMSLNRYEIASLHSLDASVVGVHTNLPGPGVRLDDVALARCAVDHLIGLGHRRIAMIASDCSATPVHVVAGMRSQGYRQALRAAGIPFDPELTVTSDDTSVGGVRAMSALVARPALPTAVFAHTDELAFGAMATLRGTGLRVPEDVSVVAVDNSRLAAAFQLTTVAQSIGDQGARAAELVVASMRSDGGRGADPAPAGQAPELVVRTSTAPPRDRRPPGP